MPQFTIRRLFLVLVGIALVLGGCRWLTSDAAAFYLSTGRLMPSTASVISSTDDHGGWPGDGRYTLRFQTSPSIIESWLSDETIFWGDSHWRKGPLEAEIPLSLALLHELKGKKVWYAVRPREPSQYAPYHNGELVIVEPDTGTVWFTIWDM